MVANSEDRFSLTRPIYCKFRNVRDNFISAALKDIFAMLEIRGFA